MKKSRLPERIRAAEEYDGLNFARSGQTMGKRKIQGLTNGWYGFDVFAFLVHLVMALLGSSFFGAFISVPSVIVSSLISLVITWVIGRLLISRSSLTRVVLLVLSPIGFVLSLVSAWHLLAGSWSLSVIATTVLVIASAYMQFRSFFTLLDKDVRAYFR
jgi:hypothetical protein